MTATGLDIIRFKKASDRAQKAFALLGVMPDQLDRRRAVADRVEQFLWRFLRLRWHDIHQFFSSVEPKEAMELSREIFSPGKVFHFFSERQGETEFEDTLTIGITLLFASMNQAQKRGFDPNTVGLFTLERMMEQVVEPVCDLEELLKLGEPLPAPK
jgi:hypothetical protein